MDEQVAGCAQAQRARLTEAASRGVLSIGLRAVAIGGKIDIATDGQITMRVAGRDRADDIHAGTQAHGPQCGQPCRQPGIAQRGIHPCSVGWVNHRIQPRLGNQLAASAVHIRRVSQGAPS
ncbi:hypothetical protein NMB32_18675 [Stenotrophomonas sp. CD2]|nr:hypothetical protein NMB32_18675 [Stenotrophomonas sp. CD2]